MDKSLIKSGSILDVAKNGDTALALLNAKVVVLCDRSGSMAAVARRGKACYELEDEIVTRLQAKYPGQLALMAFSSTAYLCPDGNLPPPNGDTNMLDALDKAQPLVDAGLRAILITDGLPSHPEGDILARAAQFRGKLDNIFVGQETNGGAEFLKRLAAVVGGSHSVANLKKDPALLENNLTRLLLAAGTK